MIRNPDATTLNDIAIFFFDGENIPYTEEDPLANCSSREDFQNVVRLMGVLGRDDFLLFTERFVPLHRQKCTLTYSQVWILNLSMNQV
jgi:hypothetical protein